jgi:hypothetical protein
MKQISLNNGNSYMTAAEAIEELYNENSSYCGGWDAIVWAMDDETREEAVAETDYPAECDERTERELFLTKYLELAENDLTIG